MLSQICKLGGILVHEVQKEFFQCNLSPCTPLAFLLSLSCLLFLYFTFLLPLYLLIPFCIYLLSFSLFLFLSFDHYSV